VETTAGPVSDDARTVLIHAALAIQELLPTSHLVDTGYVDAKLLLESQQQYGIDLVGPARANYKWQARKETGFAASQFVVRKRSMLSAPKGM
jgi:transposase